MYNFPFVFFYRATLFVSAVFPLVRRLSVCLSVSLSVCHVGVLYISAAEDTVKLLSRHGSSIALVFDPSTGTQSEGNPSAGAQNTRGGKTLRFSTEITVYPGNSTR